MVRLVRRKGKALSQAIKNVSEMSKLAIALESEGFNTTEIEKIFFKNGERIIKDVLK